VRAGALQLRFPPIRDWARPPAHATSQPLVLLLPLQGLLKKHEAFETDFTVHKDRVNDVCSNGQDLIKKVSLACWGDAHFPHPAPPCSGHRGPTKPICLEYSPTKGLHGDREHFHCCIS